MNHELTHAEAATLLRAHNVVPDIDETASLPEIAARLGLGQTTRIEPIDTEPHTPVETQGLL